MRRVTCREARFHGNRISPATFFELAEQVQPGHNLECEALARDGHWVYLARDAVTSGRWRIPVAGGPEELVLDALHPSFWGLRAVTNDGVYFLDAAPDRQSECSLEFLDLQTGKVQRIAVLDGVTTVHDQGLTVSPHGRTVLFPRLEQTTGEIVTSTEDPHATRGGLEGAGHIRDGTCSIGQQRALTAEAMLPAVGEWRLRLVTDSLRSCLASAIPADAPLTPRHATRYAVSGLAGSRGLRASRRIR